MGIKIDPEIEVLHKKIRLDLLDSFFGNIRRNFKLFETKDDLLLNLICSIILNFNIEIISHTISTFGIEGNRKQFMKDLFEHIRNEVNKDIKKRMM